MAGRVEFTKTTTHPTAGPSTEVIPIEKKGLTAFYNRSRYYTPWPGVQSRTQAHPSDLGSVLSDTLHHTLPEKCGKHMSESQTRKTAACRSGKSNPRVWKEDTKSCIKPYMNIFTDKYIYSVGAMLLRAQVSLAVCPNGDLREHNAPDPRTAAHRKPDTPLVFSAALRALRGQKRCSSRPFA